MTTWLGLNPEAKDLLSQSVFAIEASEAELRYVLLKSKEVGTPVELLQRGGGMITLAVHLIDGIERAVTVEVRYGSYKGKVVLFYWGSSTLVDHNLNKKWIKEVGLGDRNCYAEDYYRALNHIDQIPEAV